MSLRVVYDTMLFFQAASRPERLHATIRAVQEQRVTLCISFELLAEVQDVLTRPEHRIKFPALDPEAVKLFLADVTSNAMIVEPVPVAFTWPDHPDDDHLFNLAIVAEADYLVTWETRILKLATVPTPAANLLRQLAPNLAIVTPKRLAELLRGRTPPAHDPPPLPPIH